MWAATGTGGLTRKGANDDRRGRYFLGTVVLSRGGVGVPDLLDIPKPGAYVPVADYQVGWEG